MLKYLLYTIINKIKNDDENGPINKLNKITSYIGNSFVITYGAISIKDCVSTSIDSLHNDNKLHIGIINASGTYICLAQKYSNSNYASGLVFGYNTEKILYQRKRDGSWNTVREI